MHLHSFQKRALTALESPQHVLVIAPTGSGKSLIFERSSQNPNRRTLLVTPLVALARQQYQRLSETRGESVRIAIGGEPLPGAFETSSTEMLICSPESLLSPSRIHALNLWKPNFLVVDECHCLWEWGDRFRPAFQKLPQLLNDYDIRTSLWLTATLPPRYRDELRKVFHGSLIEIGEFDLPPSLRLEVVRVSWANRPSLLADWASQQTGAGLVFVNTREETQRIERLLRGAGVVRVASYHGGLSLEERRTIERQVATEELQVVVSTSAFGMGMNYPHLEWVVIWRAPNSLLNLTQAIGRVGRTANRPARALVLWDEPDFQLNEWLWRESALKREEQTRVRDFLSADLCRRSFLMNYFQAPSVPQAPCGRCDRCLQLAF